MFGITGVTDYYVDGQEEMDIWCEILSSLTIMVDLLEDYEVMEKIGEGYFSKVFRAELLEDGKIFAIKSI